MKWAYASNTWKATNKKLQAWKQSTWGTTGSATGDGMALFNGFYNNSGTSATATTGNNFYINATTTGATTSTSITVPTITVGTAGTSATTGSNISISYDSSIVMPGREITEDEKLTKLIEMEEQLGKMKEQLDEALHMSKKLMKSRGDARRLSNLRKMFTPRIEAIQAEAQVIVEEAAEVMLFQG